MSAAAARKGSHPFLKFLLLVAVVVLAGGIALSVWGVHRFDALVGAGKQIAKRYEKLNNSFAYDPPTSRTQPAAQATHPRYEAMFAARRRLIEGMPAADADRLRDLLGGTMPGRVELIGETLKLAPALSQAASAHADALEQEKMSPKEYRWLLGTLVAAALRDPDRHPAGRTMIDVVDRLQRVKESVGEEAKHLMPKEGLELIRRLWADAPPPDPALVDRLDRESGPALALFDLIALTGGEEYSQ